MLANYRHGVLTHLQQCQLHRCLPLQAREKQKAFESFVCVCVFLVGLEILVLCGRSCEISAMADEVHSKKLDVKYAVQSRFFGGVILAYLNSVRV